MGKYSHKLKIEVVKAYLDNKGSYKALADKYGITAESNIRKWVKVYNVLGEEGLKPSENIRSYSFDFKLSVVKLYLTTELTFQDIALKFAISNPSMLSYWVKKFREKGPEALRERKKNQDSAMEKVKKKKDATINAETLKKLEDENLKLRIENDYLKELRRLRLKEEAQKQKQELSAVSEDFID